jgi:hypothetical protein
MDPLVAQEKEILCAVMRKRSSCPSITMLIPGAAHLTLGQHEQISLGLQVFHLSPGDVFWCTADCGWVTGHT